MVSIVSFVYISETGVEFLNKRKRNGNAWDGRYLILLTKEM